MSYYRFNPVCVIRVSGLKMLWVITGYGLSQYGLSQVWLYIVKSEIIHTLGKHQILWIITDYELSQVYPVCVIRVGLKMVWVTVDPCL